MNERTQMITDDAHQKIRALNALRQRNRQHFAEVPPPSRESLIDFVMDHLDAYHAAIEAKRQYHAFHRTPVALAAAEQVELRRHCAGRCLGGLEVFLKLK
jgi:hemerythrin-like domain-containing protein